MVSGMQSSSNNSITGNTIGLSSSGAPLGNFSDGIALIGGTGNTITGNVISANGSGVDAAGINLTGNTTTGSTSANVISGNKIGTSADGQGGQGHLARWHLPRQRRQQQRRSAREMSFPPMVRPAARASGVHIFGSATSGKFCLRQPHRYRCQAEPSG